MQIPTTQVVFSVSQLAVKTGKSTDTIRTLIKSGRLKATNDSQGARPVYSVLWDDYLDYRDKFSTRTMARQQSTKPKPKRSHF